MNSRNFRLKAGHFALTLVLFLFSISAGADSKKPGGELKMGKWVGTLKIDGSKEAVAMTLDSFLFQPDDLKLFPRVHLLFKVSLGGYDGAEYQAEMFKDVQYDFNQGILSLDEPENELVINALIYAQPKHHMEGRVQVRSSGVSGNMILVYQTDEPEDGDAKAKTKDTADPFLLSLAGQYEGSCGKRQAVIQVTTARGISPADAIPYIGLTRYAVTGRLGLEDQELCAGTSISGRPVWCTDRYFSSGSFNFYTGRLLLTSGLGTEECDRSGDSLTCRIRIYDKTERCDFKKTAVTTKSFKVYTRKYKVAPTTDQKKPLPPVTPPESKDLVAALRGNFSGYLHHENSDRYQPLVLKVMPSTSTENPHIENNVYVSVISSLYFGKSLTGESWPEKYERRSFYLRPGYFLESKTEDSQLEILEWKMGYIRGNWYSHEYGFVGTFELVKSDTLPELTSSAKTVPPIAGKFRGPKGRPGSQDDLWHYSVLVPNQPKLANKSFLFFQGELQLFTSVPWPRRNIIRGAYDFYSGSIGWFGEGLEKDAIVMTTGRVEDDAGMRLFWPSASKWGVGIFDFGLDAYRRELLNAEIRRTL